MVEGFKNTEVGVIPEDWGVATFAEIADKNRKWSITGGPFGSNLKTTDYTPTGVQIIQLQNIGDGVFHNDYQIFTSEKKADELMSCNIFPDELILSKMGDPVARICFVPKGANRYLMASDGIRLVVNEKEFSKRFVHDYINSPFFRKRAFDASSGSTRLRIGLPTLKNLLVIKPPLAEQTAIATTLNDADALINQLEKLIAKKKAMKQGAVQELFKQKKGWQTKSLGDIANIRRGASPRPIKDPKWFSQKGRGWIRISDVTSSNVYLNSTTQYLSEEGVKYSVPVDKGDLIMSICATIGVPVIINIPACIHDGFVLFSNYENNLDTFYLYFFLQKETDALVGKGQPGTQKNLNISIVGNIEISFPSVEEQKKIGLILKDIDIELSGLEQRLEKQKQLKQGMMQSLLTGKIRLI